MAGFWWGMIDLVIGSRTDAFAQMAAKLGLTLWYIPSHEAAFWSPKGRQAKLTIIDGQHPSLRAQVERGFANAVINLETDPKPDGMHARRSGLNQVLAAILAKRKCLVLFNHGLIRGTNGRERAVLLGRMQQNVMLCQKYKVAMVIVTLAKSPYALRSPHDLRSFALQLGMTPGEAKHAITALK